MIDGKYEIVREDRAKTKSSLRSLLLVANIRDKLLALKEQQKENKRICGNCYNREYDGYVFVDAMGNIFNPRNLSSNFSKLLEMKGLRHIRFHDLRHSGASPAALRTVQHRLLTTGRIGWFNSPDHDTTLTNVAAGRGVCLAPGFLNDHSGQFAWIPFDCRESFSCVLCAHKNDNRPSVGVFLDILKKLYRDAVAFPL